MPQTRPPRSSFWLLAALVAPMSVASPLAGQTIDVVEMTVADVQAGYLEGHFTAVDLTRAFLLRIERYESRYNAFISMNPEALSVAAALDAEYARSGPRGPLHGVPIVIKDNIDYAGLVTTAGWEGFSAEAGGVEPPSSSSRFSLSARSSSSPTIGAPSPRRSPLRDCASRSHRARH